MVAMLRPNLNMKSCNCQTVEQTEDAVLGFLVIILGSGKYCEFLRTRQRKECLSCYERLLLAVRQETCFPARCMSEEVYNMSRKILTQQTKMTDLTCRDSPGRFVQERLRTGTRLAASTMFPRLANTSCTSPSPRCHMPCPQSAPASTLASAKCGEEDC